MAPLLALALLASRPLPDPRDLHEGQVATQCILLYRLQPPDVPTDSAFCEDAGYGLDFIRERDPEIRAMEQRHADELAHGREEGRARAEAQKHRAELEVPCRELALETGPGPDGGAHLCSLAGLSPTVIAAELNRERIAALARDEAEKPQRFHLGLGLVIAIAQLAAFVGLVKRQNRRVPPA